MLTNDQHDYNAYTIEYSDLVAQGGLALLAEHLPLLYPEITQQQLSSKPPSGVGGGGSAGNTESSNTAAELSDQDYEFVTQVKGISLGDIQVRVH